MNLLSIFDIGKTLVERLVPDPKAKAEALRHLAELQQSGDLATMAQQADIDEIEAANPNVFIAGWRPFIGWICGGGLAIQFIVGPLVEWASALGGHPTRMPTLETGTLTTLLIGMLGLGGMRTVEKLQGAADNH
jgi:hypothetical protein